MTGPREHLRYGFERVLAEEFAKTGLSRDSKEGKRTYTRIYQRLYDQAFRRECQSKNRKGYTELHKFREAVAGEFAKTGLSRNSEEGGQAYRRIYNRMYNREFRREYRKKWYANRSPVQQFDKQLK